MKRRKQRRQQQTQVLQAQIRQLQKQLEQRNKEVAHYKMLLIKYGAALSVYQKQMQTIFKHHRCPTSVHTGPPHHGIMQTSVKPAPQQLRPSEENTSRPKHAFEFSIRYEGEGIIDANVVELFKSRHTPINRNSPRCSVPAPQGNRTSGRYGTSSNAGANLSRPIPSRVTNRPQR